jgi:hypothetical protein
MTVRSLLRRAGVATGAATALVLVGTTAASAHDCFIPMYTLNAPHSQNWMTFTARDAAFEFGLLDPAETCQAQVDAGYAALREAGLPVGIRIFGKMTIGEGNNFHKLFSEDYEGPTGSGQGASTNPNGANGKGPEYFEAGSTLPDEMLGTFVGAAGSTSCGA